jgi:hypothetical protein
MEYKHVAVQYHKRHIIARIQYLYLVNYRDLVTASTVMQHQPTVEPYCCHGAYWLLLKSSECRYPGSTHEKIVK